MLDSQADNFLGHETHDKHEYDSRRGFVVHSDTKRPKVENMEWRPVIINIAHSDAGRPELRYVLQGICGNINNMR